ncbi:MAG: TusE/DsrC/DsvC family sulfur relay protein [Rhodocyclaceae bacterium]|nr:TusE/DsrC/DsvC family sulfur relay protein [Rhodocyclaceae bacterium]
MIVVNSKEIGTDAEGYLANLEDWSEEIASYLSEQDQLQLTESHWEIINFMRSYFHENGVAPNLRILQKLLKAELGEEKADKKYLFDLFPYGPAKQAARYAGMPKPTGCV